MKPISASRIWPGRLLGLCAGAYGLFRISRPSLPAGLLRDCFPSLLLPLVMFSLVDLRQGIRFDTRGRKILVFSCTLAASVAWFEVAVPAIYKRSTGDWKDAAAMVLGFLLYLLQDFLLHGREILHDGPPTTLSQESARSVSRSKAIRPFTSAVAACGQRGIQHIAAP